MASTVYTDPQVRHDFVLLFEVHNGNPNGDPDAGNLPRVDPETMHGLVTDVCLKRKVRDWVALTMAGEEGYEIYVQRRGLALNQQHERAYNALGIQPQKTPRRETQDKVRAWMCRTFYDIRMFGAVMTTEVNAGQVRGPVQLTFARSIDPITPLDLAITRVAITKQDDLERGKETEMGRKAIVPYGLYRCHGFFSPAFAQQTGASERDLEVFWRALQAMWDLDRSASRGEMTCRGLYIFSHSSRLGNAPAHTLFARITVQKRPGVDSPRSFADYEVRVDEKDLPAGVSLTRLVG